jgi:hypothetical protein
MFAELIPELVNWQSGLEGWEVRESQYSKTIEARGELKGQLKGGRERYCSGSFGFAWERPPRSRSG